MSFTGNPAAPVNDRLPQQSGRRWWLVAAIGVFGLLAGVAVLLAGGWQTEAPISGYRVTNTYPHDRQAFSQGLVFHDGRLYEGTGQYGASSLRVVEPETGRVLQQVSLDRQFFGEGITLMGDSIYQLTWKSRRAFVFDRQTLQYQKTFQYSGEGWGLTHNGTHLIMSDGTSTLRFFDPATFHEVRRIAVRDGRRRIDNLNELEYVGGQIYANIWYSDQIARISPEDGRVVGWIDLSTLWPARARPDRENVLNGIAHNPQTDHLYVTGKNWPKLYEIEIVPAVAR